MVRVLSMLQREYIDKLDHEHDMTGRAVASVNVLEGGHAPNIIPDYCMCEVDRRLVPGEDALSQLDEVAALLDTLKQDHPGMEVSQSLRIAHPPLLPESSEAILPLVKAALNACGVRKPAVGAPFATHAGYLSQAGLPTLVLGPGSPHPAHTKVEWVAVKEIELGVNVYNTLMNVDFTPQ